MDIDCIDIFDCYMQSEAILHERNRKNQTKRWWIIWTRLIIVFNITWFHLGRIEAGMAYVGSIGSNSYFYGFNNDKAANPKNVWKTSTTLPGLSEIPPYPSWQFNIYPYSLDWSIQSCLSIMQNVEYIHQE